MTIPAIPVKFAIYKSLAGFEALETKDEYTLYFIRETLQLYQGQHLYNDVIQVNTLPDSGIPLKIYLVGGTDVYLRSTDDWIRLNNLETGGGALEGTGILLNGKVIGGVKKVISETENLVIPEDWQYNTKNSLSLEGVIENDGEIHID